MFCLIIWYIRALRTVLSVLCLTVCYVSVSRTVFFPVLFVAFVSRAQTIKQNKSVSCFCQFPVLKSFRVFAFVAFLSVVIKKTECPSFVTKIS